jgi:hypothetical protein
MAIYSHLKEAIVTEVEGWASAAPNSAVRKRARAALGDAGTGPTYNTVTVDGQTLLVGSMFGFPADPADPAAGPDPTFVDRTGIPLLLHGLHDFLHRFHAAAASDPTGTDDEDAGYDPGSRWARLDTGETWTCHDATPGAAVWVADGGGGGGGISATDNPSAGDITGSYSAGLNISSSVISAAARTVLDDASVAAMLATLGGVPTTRTLTGSGAVKIAGDNAAHDLSADRTISVADADGSNKGVVQLASDLGGSATAPWVVALHESGGQQLTLGTVDDLQVIRRNGTSVEGVAIGDLGGDVTPQPPTGATLDRWLWPCESGGSAGITTGGAAAGSIQRFFRVTPEIWLQIVAALAMRVTSSAGGSHVIRIALYSVGADGYPDALIIDFGELSIATTGLKTMTGLSQGIPPYCYLALWQSANASLRAISFAIVHMGLGLDATLNTEVGQVWEKTGATLHARCLDLAGDRAVRHERREHAGWRLPNARVQPRIRRRPCRSAPYACGVTHRARRRNGSATGWRGCRRSIPCPRSSSRMVGPISASTSPR